LAVISDILHIIDFNKTWIDFECSNCSYLDEIQLVDVKSEKEVFCHNCKSKIHLNDQDGSVHSGIENMNNAMKKLVDTFKKLDK
jgi:hypothetical protein